MLAAATVYWLPGPWKGRVAILPRPRGGDWLEDEVRAWRSAGIDVIVSALTEEEQDELDLSEEPATCATLAMEYRPFPMTDRGVPASVHVVLELVASLTDRLEAGKNVCIHCRQGVGRSAVLAASLLVAAGRSASEALRQIEQARGCKVPDTLEQARWVERLAEAVGERARASSGAGSE